MLRKLFKTLIKYSLIITTFILTGLASGLIVMNIIIKSGKVPVPDITKKPLDQALIILGQNNLYPLVEGTRYDKEIPPYYIISQKPEPGKIVKKGRTVKILISKGQRVLLIPDFLGQPLREIEIKLAEKQLRIGDIVKVHSNNYAEGICMAQDPKPDEKGSPGDPVDILISLGPRRVDSLMPNLIGLKEEKAFDILNGFKVTLGKIKKVSSSSEASDTIIDQDPRPGCPLAQNQAVDLIINKISFKAQPQFLKTYRSFNYKVPAGSDNKNVKILVKNAKGSKELFNKNTTPGKSISLIVEVIGKTYVTIFVDGIKTMEQSF